MAPDTNAEKEKIGVYVCHCGSNIAGMVDVEDVATLGWRRAKDRGVVVSRDYKFMCSSLGQELIEKDIKELGLTRVVVAACSRTCTSKLSGKPQPTPG
jgi:heterodisulfide reductase subunit A2